MFSPIELVVLLVLGAGAGLAVLRLFRPQIQRAVANAPSGAFRTSAQRRLHWAALACLLPPLGYIFAVDGEHFFPILGSLATNTAVMHALRAARVTYMSRLWLIPFVSAGSAFAGALIAAWPHVEAESLVAAPWLVLLATNACIGLSTALSIYSFPLGFGERAT